jgi:hypothetical protein
VCTVFSKLLIAGGRHLPSTPRQIAPVAVPRLGLRFEYLLEPGQIGLIEVRDLIRIGERRGQRV